MDAQAKEEKPKIENAEGSSSTEEHLNLKVKDQDGSEVYFKIKRSTPLSKLMNAYCERQGKSPDSVRFLFDGQRIQPHHKPADLKMEDQDHIDVMMTQVGGC